MVAGEGKRRVFYGWWIVLAAAIASALSGGFYFYGFSTFFMPLVKEFGWSRTAVSGAFSLSRIEGGILGPVGGFLVDRFGPRKMMLIGIVMMGAGFVLFSRIDSLVAFYLVFVLAIAAGATLGIHQAALVAVANWFVKKRGTALGVATSGVGLGGVLVPLLGWLIVQYGWRSTSTTIGLLIWAVGIPLAMLMRHRPEQYGRLPDGEVARGSRAQEKPDMVKGKHPSPMTVVKEKVSAKDMDFTAFQALRTTAFWLLALIFGLRQMVVGAVVVHQIPFLVGLGISPELAAIVLGSIGVFSIAGRIGFGRLADLIEKRYVLVTCLGLTALGLFILANARTLWHVILFLIVYPPAYGGGATLMHAIRGEYFGRRHFGTITGFMDLAQLFGTVLGPVFAGRVFDVTGSYRLAFMAFAIAAALGMVLVLIVRRPVYRGAERSDNG